MRSSLVLSLLCVASASPGLAPKRKRSLSLKRGGGGEGRKRPASELLSPQETLFAGACARVVAQSLLHPLDVVRTRTQAKSMGSSTLRESLAFGLIPQVALSAPAGAVQFSAVKQARSTTRVAQRRRRRRQEPETWVGGRVCRSIPQKLPTSVPGRGSHL